MPANINHEQFFFLHRSISNTMEVAELRDECNPSHPFPGTTNVTFGHFSTRLIAWLNVTKHLWRTPIWGQKAITILFTLWLHFVLTLGPSRFAIFCELSIQDSFLQFQNESRFIESILFTLKRAEIFQLSNYIFAGKHQKPISAQVLFTEVR